MRIQHLSLSNFKGFEKLEVKLPEGPYCVFVGRNGSGKSSVAEALWTAVSQAAMTACDVPFSLKSEGWVLWDDDIRLGADSCTARITTDDKLNLAVTRTRGQLPLNSIEGTVEDWKELGKGPVLPVLQSMPTDRPSRRLEIQAHIPQDPRVPEAWRGAFHEGVNVFTTLLPWFRREENLENEVRLASNPDHRNPALEVVRSALKAFLSDIDNNEYERPRISRVDPSGNPLAPATDGVLVFNKGDTQLTLAQLSDGERMVLLLVMDLARRLAMANKGAASPLEGDGVVVIDELEQHLHPAWQRGLLPALHATFPGLQFIVTTHSPLVVASVPGSAIRILHDFQVYESPPTEGRDSNSLLSDVFGVSPRPADWAEKLKAISKLIDAEHLDEARTELADVANTLTNEDPEVVRLRSMLAFLSG